VGLVSSIPSQEIGWEERLRNDLDVIFFHRFDIVAGVDKALTNSLTATGNSCAIWDDRTNCIFAKSHNLLAEPQRFTRMFSGTSV